MEAVTVAGLAVVIVGGLYSLLDLIRDLGLEPRLMRAEKKMRGVRSSRLSTPQGRIEKMAGMHV